MTYHVGQFTVTFLVSVFWIVVVQLHLFVHLDETSLANSLLFR